MPGSWIPLKGPPRFPDGCACCLAASAERVLLPSKFRIAEHLLMPEDRPWEVPFCEPCARHVARTREITSQAKKRWTRTAMVLFAPALVAHDLLIVSTPIFILGSLLVFGLSRLKVRRVPIAPGCVSPTPAVVRRGPERGSQYLVRCLNPRYEERFRAAL